MAWNLGNTTVRNPQRIKEGLTLFAREFNGNLDGADQELHFWYRLKQTEIVADKNLEETGEVTVKDADAINGRKWRSCFYQMGFITANDYRKRAGRQVTLTEFISEGLGLTGKPYELTPIGRRLVNATTQGAIQDVFLRQLLRLEITSPLESEPDTVQVKPLVLVLQILDRLEKRNEPGLNKEEIAAFVQTASHHNDVEERVERIVAHRRERDTKYGRAGKRRHDNATIVAEINESGYTIKPESFVDYADTTYRYVRLTGLFALNGRRLVIRSERRAAVNVILRDEPQFVAPTDPIRYLAEFYRGGPIPTDDADTALAEIRRYGELLLQRGITPRIQADDLMGLPPHDISAHRYTIQEQYKVAREKEFAEAHWQTDAVITDTLNYLKKLNGEKNIEVDIDEPPMYLEWATWRGLLTFDSLDGTADKTRNFEIDEDMQPTRTASSGKADIVMNYNEFVLVTEVTMKTGSRQEGAEGEPVRRHVADVLGARTDKEVYGLFIAPEIDYNTAETFRIGVWYKQEDVSFLNILPIPLRTYISIIECMLQRRRQPAELKTLLDRCLVFRNAMAPQWIRKIQQEVSVWVQNP